MTMITFVRHGNTDWNIEKRAQGHSDNPLNDIGFKQAEAVAQRLGIDQWDEFISSDLLRARQTAEIISPYIGKSMKFDQRLRERSRGKIEGTIEEERIEKWGEDWRKLELNQETYQSLRERGSNFVEDMLVQHPGKKVLAVCHGRLLIQTLHALFPEETTGDELLRNASVTIIKKTDDGWRYLLYDCTCHLKIEELTK